MSAISGATRFYGGGGGGGAACGTPGLGGTGGGGSGTLVGDLTTGFAGQAGSGSGGGGIGNYSTLTSAPTNGGGSGVVIIRYTEPQSTSPFFGLIASVASSIALHCPVGAFISGFPAHSFGSSLNSFTAACSSGATLAAGTVTGTTGAARSCSTGGYTGAVGYSGADASNAGRISGVALYCSDTSALQTVGNAGLSGVPTSVMPFQCPFGQRILSVSGFAPSDGSVVQGLFFTCGYAGAQVKAIADYTNTGLITTPIGQARGVRAWCGWGTWIAGWVGGSSI
jgi:hypothetical protein